MSEIARNYATEIFWSDDDEGFIAVVADLPGCSAFGETREAATRELEDAISAWIASAKKSGNPIPSPSEKRDIEDFSGKLLLRMPKELHSDLHLGAQKQGVSLNSYVCHVLSQRHYSSVAVEEFTQSLIRKSVFMRRENTNHKVIIIGTNSLGGTVDESVSKSTGAFKFNPFLSEGALRHA